MTNNELNNLSKILKYADYYSSEFNIKKTKILDCEITLGLLSIIIDQSRKRTLASLSLNVLARRLGTSTSKIDSRLKYLSTYSMILVYRNREVTYGNNFLVNPIVERMLLADWGQFENDKGTSWISAELIKLISRAENRLRLGAIIQGFNSDCHYGELENGA